MFTITINRHDLKYFNIEVKPDMYLTEAEQFRLINNKPILQTDNTTVNFSLCGGCQVSGRNGQYDYKYSIPVAQNYTSWWNGVDRTFRFLFYMKKYLTNLEIPFKVDGDFGHRFNLTNDKGRIYAYYLRH